jgi:hypothetical protein
MGVGVRTGKPPDNGESAAADLRGASLAGDEAIVLAGPDDE